MGLDITAYKNIRNIKAGEDYYFYNSGFEQSNMPEIENREIDIDYEEDFDFCAGLYSRYNFFRNKLCELANGIKAEELWEIEDTKMKFYYLINFSDCEGYIGTSYCKILYEEFSKYENEILNKNNDDENFKRTYMNFKEAFKIASENGLVRFC